MLIDIYVYRYDGDKNGDDIIEPLLGSVGAAIHRGRNELDKRASALQEVDKDTVYRDGVRLGHLLKFYDTMTGMFWYGMVTSIEHKFEDAELTTSLTVEKPSNFFVA